MSDTTTLLAQLATAINADHDALTAANIALQAQLDTANATIADLQAKLDPWAKVDKTGATDVTAQFQALIDQGLPVPAGRYLIDPVVGVLAKRDLTMHPDAVLVAKPNSAPRYAVLTLLGNDLSLKGGQILGDRLAHTYTVGSTHEWGCGLMLVGDRCTVDGLKVRQCTGDGIEAVGDNCTIRNVVSTQNRRQAMSAFDAPGLKVYDSEFSDTGTYLTDPAAPNGPCAGVDIEPDHAATVDAYFERCKFLRNRAGVLAWLRSEVGGSLSVTVQNCEIGGNANGVQGKALAGKVTMAANANRFVSNRNSNVRAEFGSVITVNGNTSTGLLQRYALLATGPSPLAPGVIVQSANTYA